MQKKKMWSLPLLFCFKDKNLGCNISYKHSLSKINRSQHDAGSLLFHFVNQNCHPSSSSSSSQYIEHLSLLVGSSVARLKFGHERKFVFFFLFSGCFFLDLFNFYTFKTIHNYFRNDETTVTPNTIITETPFWGDEDVGYLLLCFRHDLTQMWKGK